jgi:NO-binding membrane sensor protein with MHYT domain
VLDFSHDWRLVLASLAIALMAGFTGLSLTRGASRLAPAHRKAVVAMAAIVLGGGIWSMHFVAMLGLRLPILYFYDPLSTLISALAAILMTGLALLILHFRPRTTASLTLAGGIIGAGISVMHYIGMMGMEMCLPVFTPLGVAGAGFASVMLSVLAVRLAYGERGRRNILQGTVGFGLAVVLVHFIAMAGTGFLPVDGAGDPGPAIGNETLAILVTLAAFTICSAFLLTAITFLPGPQEEAKAPEPATPPPQPAAPRGETPLRIPHEREGRTLFIDPATVSALRAEGHYTVILRGSETLFCPWSITEAEERLSPAGFLRVHRSYLLNPARVARFERLKDTGLCLIDGDGNLKIPVSRNRLPDLRAALGV